MPTVSFLGKTFPSISVKLSYTNPLPITWLVDQAGQVAFKVKIENSDIQVDCTVSTYTEKTASALLRPAYDLARGMVDLAAFSCGFGWFVFIDTFIDPGGKRKSLIYTHHEMSAECTAFNMNPTTPEERLAFDKVITAVFTDTALMFAISDLVETIVKGNIQPVNCGRVLDGLRKMVAPSLSPSAGWRVLRGIVNVDEKYMRFVSDLATQPRHGDRSFIAGPQVWESVRRCWIIMNRYLEYRKRDKQRLPLTDFPMLTG